MRQKFTLICVPAYISARPNLLKANTGQAQTQYKKEAILRASFSLCFLYYSVYAFRIIRMT